MMVSLKIIVRPLPRNASQQRYQLVAMMMQFGLCGPSLKDTHIQEWSDMIGACRICSFIARRC